MCDYSLQGLPNRLAIENEELVTHRFTTGSIGLASPLDIDQCLCQRRALSAGSFWTRLKNWMNPPAAGDLPAVCIPPGTSLIMSKIPEKVRREFALSAREDVTFAQLSAEAFRYRDAIRLASGKYILLQAFPNGVQFEVVALVPAETDSAHNQTATLTAPQAVGQAG